MFFYDLNNKGQPCQLIIEEQEFLFEYSVLPSKESSSEGPMIQTRHQTNRLIHFKSINLNFNKKSQKLLDRALQFLQFFFSAVTLKYVMALWISALEKIFFREMFGNKNYCYLPSFGSGMFMTQQNLVFKFPPRDSFVRDLDSIFGKGKTLKKTVFVNVEQF